MSGSFSNPGLPRPSSVPGSDISLEETPQNGGTEMEMSAWQKKVMSGEAMEIQDEESDINYNDFGLDNPEEKTLLKTKYSTLINHMPFGYFQWRMVIVCGMAWFLDGCEFYVDYFLLDILERDHGFSEQDTRTIRTVKNLASAFGAITFGAAASRLGTKKAYMLAIFITTVFGFLSAAVDDFAIILITRSLVGLGIGGNLPLAIIYLREFIPKHQQERTIILMQLWGAMGIFFTLICDYFVKDNWQLFAILMAIPGIIALALSYQGPENPYYLIKYEQGERVMKLLLDMRIPIPENFRLDESISLLDDYPFRLCHKVNGWYLGLMWFACSFAEHSNYYFPRIFEADLDGDSREYHHYIAFNTCVQIISFIISGLIINYFMPEKYLLAVLCCVLFCYILLIIAVAIKNEFFFGVCTSLFAIPWGSTFCLLYAVTPRLFDPTLRTTVMGFCAFFFWMGRVVAPHVGDAIMDVSDLGGLFVFGSGWIIALCSLLLVFKKREILIYDDTSFRRLSFQDKPQTFDF